jgi:hypothetical protein
MRGSGSDIDALRRSWAVAARDLGIRVMIDDPRLRSDQGHQFPLVAVIPDFGGGSGTAILPETNAEAAALATQQGYGYTSLGSSYETYVRADFIDALNDWQWTGEGDAPSWYTGEPWTT